MPALILRYYSLLALTPTLEGEIFLYISSFSISKVGKVGIPLRLQDIQST